MIARAPLLVAGVLSLVFLPGCESQSGESHPLTGRKAPLFTATMLDGASFDLAQYLGKNIVILDFWATWCGPCRQALPILSQVAAEYQDRGVEFFAVDLRESPEDVQQFLDETMLSLAVVMDRDGAISDLYQVEYVPQTVIIGKDGTVAVVHVGSSSGLKAQLTRELDQLLAGEKLAHLPARPIELARRGVRSP